MESQRVSNKKVRRLKLKIPEDFCGSLLLRQLLLPECKRSSRQGADPISAKHLINYQIIMEDYNVRNDQDAIILCGSL